MKIVSVIFGLILIFRTGATSGSGLQKTSSAGIDTLRYDGIFSSDNASLGNLVPRVDSVKVEICYPATEKSFASLPVQFKFFSRSVPPVYSVHFPARETREPVSPGVEYTADSIAGAMMTGKNETVGLTPGQALYFRTKAVDNIFSSVWYVLDVPSAPDVDGIAIDFLNEKLTHLPAGALWRVNDGGEMPVRPDLSRLIPGDGSAKVSVQIYVPGNDRRFASDIRQLIIPARPRITLKDMKRRIEDPAFIPELQLPAEFRGGKVLLTGSDESVARIDGDRIVPVGIGKCTVTAMLEAGGDHFASVPVTASLEVTGMAGENMPEVSVNNLVLADGRAGDTALKFEITGTAGARKLLVFNVAGKVVYRSVDYKNDYDMAKLQAGTYYYVLSCCVENHNLVKKGFVEVVK